MAQLNIVLPAMGEGVIEATINKWLVSEGTMVREDDPLVEVATDKVDSEVPAPAEGKIVSIIAKEGSVIKIGEIIAVLENSTTPSPEESQKVLKEVERVRETISEIKNEEKVVGALSSDLKSRTPSGKFLSPLVRSIAARESLSYAELDTIDGTGMDGRITKDDIIKLLESRKKAIKASEADKAAESGKKIEKVAVAAGGDEVIEMDRVRRIIADHMVLSKKTSAHVTSFIDADVTKLVNWRNSVKDKFYSTEGQKLTLTPIFIDAAARALYEFPDDKYIS